MSIVTSQKEEFIRLALRWLPEKEASNLSIHRDTSDFFKVEYDPLEIALLEAGALAGIRRKAVLEILPEVREEAFDAESKMMATFHKDRDGFLVAVKGAPEEVFGALFAALHVLGLEEKQSVSISFLTIASAQLWHVFNMSHRGAGFLRNDVSRNPYVWMALGLCFLLLMCAVFIPLFAEILHLTTPTKEGWALVLVMSLFPLITGRILKQWPISLPRKKPGRF